MRDQRIILKYHTDIPLFHGNRRQILLAHKNISLIRILQTRNDPKKCRLSTAGGAQKGEQMPVLYLKGNIFQNTCITK